EKTAHALEFAEPEPAPIRRLADGLLQAQSEPTPIAGRTLALEPALFAADAPAIEVAWEAFRQLGLWSRAQGDFLCIEPWHGTASPADFDGEFRDKPGL